LGGVSLAQERQETLNNDSVLQMVKARLAESVIVDMIRTHPGQYLVSTAEVIKLQNAGVPANVLSAMIAKSDERRPAVRPASPDTAPPGAAVRRGVPSRAAPPVREPASPEGEWVMDEGSSRNALLEPEVRASTWFHMRDGAFVTVTAACGVNEFAQEVNAMPRQMAQMMQGLPAALGDKTMPVGTPRNPGLDDRALFFRMRYQPSRGSDVELRQTAMPQNVTRTPFGGGATISPPRSCVLMRVRVDGRGRDGARSETCDAGNEAVVMFPASGAPEAMDGLMNAKAARASSDPVDRFAGGLLGAVAQASDTTIATMKQALSANEILVDLPLTDGNSAPIPIQPRTPAFQRFVKACLASFPDPPPPSTVAAAASAPANPLAFPLAPGGSTANISLVSADKTIANATSRANAEHKNILLVFGASWCEPCHRLYQFLAAPQIRTIFEKHFVWARMNVDEEARGKPHLNSLGAEDLRAQLGGSGHVPFIVFLDRQGKPIVTSIDRKSGANIGYPAKPGEIDWFIHMLRESAPAASEPEVKTVEAWLRARGHP
jgi:hypothetical protein